MKRKNSDNDSDHDSDNDSMLTAAVRDRSAANRAFEWLQDRGYTSSEINVLMSDKTRSTFGDKGTEGKIKSGDKAMEGLATGGTIGTVVGATLGAILAIGTTVLVPGIGWVAGPVLAGLAGGGAGAVAGGLVGGLVGLGIPESNAKAYEEALARGGVVFGVVPHDSEDADTIKEYFEKNGGENIVYSEAAASHA